jgi:hypothetical protein
MGNSKNETKGSSLAKGADLAAIAPVDTFDGVPHGGKSEDTPGSRRTKTACAARIPDASVIGSPATPCHVTMSTVEDRPDWIACETAILTEHGGHSGRHWNRLLARAAIVYQHWVRCEGKRYPL